jgi:hypothetical protein
LTPEAAAQIIRQWLEETMAETGMSAPAWAKRAGLAPSTIQRALKPDYAFVTSSRTLAKLASVANRPPPELNLSPDAQVAPAFLQVRHKVQAGHWLEYDDISQVAISAPKPVAPDPKYSNSDQWLELVVGDSIDKSIGDGGFAHVVSAIDLNYEPVDGDLVVVERIRAGGLLRERTIKRVAVRPEGTTELHPDSTNSRHRPLTLTDGTAIGEEIEVLIVGKVIGAYVSFG